MRRLHELWISALILALAVVGAGCLSTDDSGGGSGVLDASQDDPGSERDRGRDIVAQPDAGQDPDVAGDDVTIDEVGTDAVDLEETGGEDPIADPVSEQVCVPSTTAPCSCVGGGSGTMTCNASGTGYGPCDCPEECTQSDFTVSGTFVTGFTNIDFTGAEATVRSTHKIDIDEEEDGCLASVTIELQLNEFGCTLSFDFGSEISAGRGGLVDVDFDADSFCPGFPDAEEDRYSTRSPGFAPWWFEDLTEVPDRLAETACVATTITFPTEEILLHGGDDKTLTVDLSGLQLTGTLQSTGNTDVICPVVDGCGDYHDGGGGLCLEEGRCVRGYVLLNDGTCLDEASLPGPECADFDLGTSVGAPIDTGTLTAGVGEVVGSCGGDGNEVTYFWTAPSTDAWDFRLYSTDFEPVIHLRERTCPGLEFSCHAPSTSDWATSTQWVQEGESVVIVVDSATSISSGSYELTIQ